MQRALSSILGIVRFGALLLLLLRPCAALASAETHYVDVAAAPGGDGTLGAPFSSPAAAVASALVRPGDTLRVRPGTYHALAGVGSKGLRYLADGPAQSVVFEQLLFAPVVRAEGTRVTLRGIVLRGGTGGAWAGLNQAAGGGVLALAGADVLLRSCLVTENTAYFGPAVACFDASVRVVDSVLSGNSHDNLGFNQPGGSLAAHVERGRLAFEGSELRGNDGLARALIDVRAGARLDLMDCDLSENRALGGGRGTGAGVRVDDGSWGWVADCRIADNLVTAIDCTRGGAYCGPGRIEDCVISGCRASDGGGVFGVQGAPGALVVVGTVIEACRACSIGCIGGGDAAWATLIDCDLVENVADATVGGGAAHCVLRGSSVLGNRCTPYITSSRYGAGLFECVALDCVLEENVVVAVATSNALARGAGAFGGAIERSLVRGNRIEAPSGFPLGLGGGLFGCAADRCVLDRNRAREGAAAADAGLARCSLLGNESLLGRPTLVASQLNSCIVVDASVPAIDASTTAVYSLFANEVAGVGNVAGDPLFVLPVSGDAHLRPGSPCIDAADPALPPDPDGSAPDIGAFPFDAAYCPSPQLWCVPRLTNNGCEPRLEWSGIASASAPASEALRLRATGLPGGAIGVWVFSVDALDAPREGRCVGSPVRMPLLGVASASDLCSGIVSHPVDFGGLPPVGSTIYGQFLFRRTSADGPGATDAIEFLVCP